MRSVAAGLRLTVPAVYLGGACLAAAGFVAAGVLLAVTLPYHQWDSFAYGDWSRLIAQHGKADPLSGGTMLASRPLFYELQGLLWSVTGISFTAGRLLSLVFAVVLVASVARLQRALTGTALETALAVAAVLAISVFAQQALSGQTDVPAAAMVALAAALALRAPRTWAGLAAVAVAAALAVVTKQVTLAALVPVAAVLLAERGRGLRAAGALAFGIAAGLVYDLAMALRFGIPLLAFLREGTAGGIYAQLAARTRSDAVLRADVLGTGLRLPLMFALVYAVLRLAGVRHRLATLPALAAGLAWCIAGPLAAGVPNGPVARPEDGFTLVGFAAILAAATLLPDEEAPRRRTLLVSLSLGLPPLAAWVASATYTPRLASAAWPGLALLIACVVGAGVRALARGGTMTALAPVPIVAMAVWMSLATFDGLHGGMWVEYRSLGWSGLGDKPRTMHVVLPTVESALAAAEPVLGDGRLVTEDPTFPWFLRGRVDTRIPLHCADLRGDRVFVLLTADEAQQGAAEAGGLVTPEQWARCRGLRQLTDGSDGFAVFQVGA